MSRGVVHKVSRATIERLRSYRRVPFERFSNWIEAGSGNYEKTQTDGRYRESCNKFHLEIDCKDHHGSKKIHWHCGKMDCVTCFITTSSVKARKINQRLLGFQKEAYRAGIKTGRILHFSLSLNHRLARKMLANYDGEFNDFMRKRIYPMLEDMGVFGGVIFTHLRSGICTSCGEKIKTCHCEAKKLYRKFNAHFHVLGFGYIINAKEFHEKYPKFVYINHGRRYDSYHTVFYILSKCSLWRKRDGKLKPCYRYFKWLHGKKFVIVKKHTRITTENCRTCGKPLIIQQSEDEREIGKPYFYYLIAREFRILSVEGLRKVAKRNIARFRAEKRSRETIHKLGNGYG